MSSIVNKKNQNDINETKGMVTNRSYYLHKSMGRFIGLQLVSYGSNGFLGLRVVWIDYGTYVHIVYTVNIFKD